MRPRRSSSHHWRSLTLCCSLRYINKAKRVKRKVIKKWCRQVLDGLAFLHKSRIIHRDLKCENIFINGNNAEIKIGDLGLSTMMKDGEHIAQSVLGASPLAPRPACMHRREACPPSPPS